MKETKGMITTMMDAHQRVTVIGMVLHLYHLPRQEFFQRQILAGICTEMQLLVKNFLHILEVHYHSVVMARCYVQGVGVMCYNAISAQIVRRLVKMITVVAG